MKPVHAIAGFSLLGAGFILGFLCKEWSGPGAPDRPSANPPVTVDLRDTGDGSGEAAAQTTDITPGAIDNAKVNAALAVLRNPRRIERIADWSRLLHEADKSGLAMLSEAMKEWYQKGGSAGKEETDLLQFREGQLLGKQTIEDRFPKEPNGRLSENYHRKMLGWASVDPSAAREWLDSLEAGSVKTALRSSWFAGAVAAAPGSVEKLYTDLPAVEKTNQLETVMEALHLRDGMAGLTHWFEQSSNDGAADWPAASAFQKLMWRAGQAANADFPAVRAILLNPANAPFLSASSVSAATRNIAINSPGTVIDLAASLADGGSFSNGELRSLVQRTVSSSSQSTINNVADWLNANPTHPLRDLTIRYFAETASRDDRGAADVWVQRIEDPALRAEAASSLNH